MDHRTEDYVRTPTPGKMLVREMGCGCQTQFCRHLLKDYSSEDMVLSALREGETRARHYSRLQLWNQVALLAQHLRNRVWVLVIALLVHLAMMWLR